jgi:hypothetical protein
MTLMAGDILELYDLTDGSTWKLLSNPSISNRNVLYSNRGYSIFVSDEESRELVNSTKMANRYLSVAATRDIIHRLVEEDRKRNLDADLYTWEDYEK